MIKNHDAQFFSGSGFPDEIVRYCPECDGTMEFKDSLNKRAKCIDCGKEFE